MGRQARRTLGALLVLGIAVAVSAPGAAGTTGNETFSGTIVTSGVSGERVVVSSVIVAKGVFSGVGRVVEIQNLPGDPDNVSRDDLVFSDGTIHIVTTSDFENASFTLNPHNCLFRGTVQQTGIFAGGTGRFAAATGSYTGSVSGGGLLPRNPDGSCAFGQASLHEEDMVASSGTLSF